MKPQSHPRSRRHCPTPLTATAVGAALLVSAFAAQAQDTQTITVTGIRKGIEDAISVKRNADGVVEAISAEDIGKLPDTTIAESLSRLPGLTTQRTKDGRASSISIRGLGPDFNGYLLNGREQTSIGDSRGVDLSVYPAELISGATVYKTSDASLMTAGLAGTIDTRLINPLDFPNRVIYGSVQKDSTGRGLPNEGSGKRYSLSYIDQFADRTIGLALGFVHSDGTTNQLGTGGWGEATVDATLTNGQVVNGVKIPAPWGAGLDFSSQRVKDDRDGVAAILAYRPNKDFNSQLDLFYSKIKTYTKKQFVKGGLGGPITNATVVNGVATKGTYSNVSLVDYIEGISDNDEVMSAGWRNTLKLQNGWKASVDLSHNSAKRIERDVEAYAGTLTTDTLTFDHTGGGTPRLTLGSPLNYTNANTIAVRDQTGWSGVNYPDGTPVPQAGYTKGPTIEDKVNAIRVDFTKDLSGGMFTDVQFGANYTVRTKDRTSDEGLIVSASGVGRDRIPFPAGSYIEKNVGGTGLDMLTFDPQAGLWAGAKLLRKYNDDILSKTWGVEEKVTTAYAKLNVDTELSGIPVRGNVGLQLVNTDQSSKGYRAEVGSGVVLNNPAKGLSTAGTTYLDVLPSLNLTGDLGDGNQVRLSVSQQIARPTMTDMRNSFAASVDTNAANSTFGKFVGSAGNPELKPFKAKALDLSYEKYFGKKGYLSAAAFYKKLDTYITPQTLVNYDFTKYAQALGLTIPPAGPIGTLTTSVNGNGGNLYGVELTASVPFNLAAAFLDGFGGSISYADTQSSVKLPNVLGKNPNQQVSKADGEIPLPGLSRKNAKLMLYYEKAGFSAFVAQNYRSTYIGSVANDAVGGYPTLRYIEGSSWVSAQVGYEMQEGPLKGLGLRLEGNNLNKPVYRQLKADGKTVDTETKTGASLSLKVNYKF
ncbi:TonB-dependent receptor [Ideonella sp. 4Y16]|uniref:TonB-dependent receptor n=1 Tax=Ideonella alba TaxID=2824118 RepID=A0A940Y622_9BURK|nr:TonB-dependent receptor [Ideonella alba]MBQ0930472.1 TonB-dependent receptor [Ideonella alba]MBQ0945278.1 TonB-dependent receptor [Ideonella alba]